MAKYFWLNFRYLKYKLKYLGINSQYFVLIDFFHAKGKRVFQNIDLTESWQVQKTTHGALKLSIALESEIIQYINNKRGNLNMNYTYDLKIKPVCFCALYSAWSNLNSVKDYVVS